MSTTLHNARESAGMSLLEVAIAIGVNPSTISRLENGLRLPMHETAQRLEELFGCTLEFTRAVSR
jgi:transcriptional regulator with XRE-family HTH domain